MDRRHVLGREILVLAIPLVAFTLLGADLLGDGAPLGHDEAVYALKAKSIADGATSEYFWTAYRAPGLPISLLAVFPFGSTAPYLRLVVLGFGLITVGFTYLVAKELFGSRAGLIAAGGVAVTPAILASSTQVWPDVPGAALSLLTMWVVLLTTRGEKFSWWVVLAAPLAWLATYVRFGAPIPLALGIAIIVAYRWRAALRSVPQIVVLAAVSGVGIWAILFLPAITGSRGAPYAAIRSLQERNAFPIYRGLYDYYRQSGLLLGGPAGFVMVLGVATSVVLAVRRVLDRRAVATTLGIALLSGLVIAVQLHGEYRYLSPVLPFLWIAGGAAIAALTRSWDRQLLITAGLIAIVAAGLSARTDAAVQNRFNDTFATLQRASQELEDRAEGPCGAITSYVPQVAWYSGCVTKNWDLDEVRLNPAGFPDGAPTYLFWVERGKRQPDATLTAEYTTQTQGLVFEEGVPGNGLAQYVQVWQISDG